MDASSEFSAFSGRELARGVDVGRPDADVHQVDLGVAGHDRVVAAVDHLDRESLKVFAEHAGVGLGYGNLVDGGQHVAQPGVAGVAGNREWKVAAPQLGWAMSLAIFTWPTKVLTKEEILPLSPVGQIRRKDRPKQWVRLDPP